MAQRTEFSNGEFVINGILSEDARKAVSGIAGFEIAELSEIDQIIVVLQVKSRSEEAKVAWQVLQRQMGDRGVVAPVMLDDTGAKSYPTGTVQVRFATVPTDSDLAGFAETHQLCRPVRNQFQPSQIAFQLANPSNSFLPDKVTELDQTPNVKRAWAESKASYRRISQAEK